MPRPARSPFLLVASAVVALAAPSPARAGEGDGAHAAAHHHHHHRRRAKAAEVVARAPRDGSGATESKKRAPAERPESIGTPNDGHLKGGAHLDVSRPWFRVVSVYESGDVRWGLPSLVRMIDRAARAVHRRFPGSALDVGDLSARGGGDVLRHHSHESGRDADLGFYVVDAKGKQIHARTFVKFDTSMASPTVPGARYDLARNWTFVQELLTDPGARVSHIFIAEWIRHEMLAYAKPRVSHALWERAALVMMQPHDSVPHDDHFHVRISCPREAHSSCIELARAAPHAHGRIARKGPPGGHVLRTPPHVTPHVGRPPAASAITPSDPLVMPDPHDATDVTDADFDAIDDALTD